MKDEDEDGDVQTNAGWCRLGYRLAAVLVQTQYFSERPVVDHCSETCLVSGACVFGGASNLPEPASLKTQLSEHLQPKVKGDGG